MYQTIQIEEMNYRMLTLYTDGKSRTKHSNKFMCFEHSYKGTKHHGCCWEKNMLGYLLASDQFLHHCKELECILQKELLNSRYWKHVKHVPGNWVR